MLRLTSIIAAVAAFLAISSARADDNSLGAPPARHVTLVQGGGFVAANQSYMVPLTGTTGLFGWGSEYKLEAGVQPNLIGGYTAGLGATIGVAPGQLGSGYSVRIGTGWAGDWVSVNPFSRLGVTEVATPAGDMALGFTYSRSILPGLSLTGTAEAYRPVGANILDPVGGVGQVVIGAGIGIRF